MATDTLIEALRRIGDTVDIVWGDNLEHPQCRSCGWRADTNMCQANCPGRIARAVLAAHAREAAVEVDRIGRLRDALGCIGAWVDPFSGEARFCGSCPHAIGKCDEFNRGVATSSTVE